MTDRSTRRPLRQSPPAAQPLATKQGKHRERQRVTLRDVATAAKVSPMTVSNFANGKYELMGEATRQRVARVAARLGYRPHASARSLRLATRMSIGMIVVDEMSAYLADPFITYVVAGLSNYLSDRGYALVLQGLAARDLTNSPLLRHVMTDGICVMLSGSDAVRRACLARLLRLDQPVVVFQERWRRHHDANLCVIRQDDRGGGEVIGRHLLACGALRLAMLVPGLNWPAIREREAGVRDAIAALRAEATLSVIDCGDISLTETQAALARHIDQEGLPQAIVAGNDQMGIAAVKLLRHRGIDVPGEVFVTGFNAFDFWEFSEPMLTTVRSPAYEMGARGGEALLHRLRHGVFAMREIVLPVHFQHGGST